MRLIVFAAVSLTCGAALAQVAPKPPPVIVMPGNNPAPNTVVATQLGNLPATADGNVSVIGQGSVRWQGGFCAPTAAQSNAVCTRPITLNRPITFRATPRPGQEFKGWAGACSGQSETCTITPTKKFALSANFAAAQMRTITVRLLKTPFGGVEVSGAGLTFNCQPVLSTPLPNGPAGPYNSVCTASTNSPSVTLEAKSVSGPHSTSVSGDMWKGPCQGQPGKTCTLTMTTDRTIHIGTTPAGPSQKTLKIFYWAAPSSNVYFTARKRGYNPFATPDNDPGTPINPNCTYIPLPMGMQGPGGTYNAVCTISSEAIFVDLKADYVLKGKSVPVQGPGDWLGGQCYGTPDSKCIVILDKDKTIYVRPQPVS